MDASGSEPLLVSLRHRVSRVAGGLRARSDRTLDRLLFLYGSRRFDERFGSHTLQSGDDLSPASPHAAGTVTPAVFHRMIAETGLDPGYCTFVDASCGGGRALLLAAADRWKAILGLASSQETCQLARRNIAAVRKRYPSIQEIEVRQGDLGSLALPMTPAVLLLGPSSSPADLQALLSALASSMQDYPREIAILCPSGTGWSVLDGAPGLRLWTSQSSYRIYMARSAAPSPKAAVAAASAFRWEALHDAGDIDGIAEEWNALARGNPASLMSDATWMRCMFDAFEDDGTRVIHLLRRHGKLEAVVPMQLKHGVPRIWYSVGNEHAVYGAITADEQAPGVIREVLRKLTADGDAVLFRRLIRTSPLFDRLLDEARDLRLPTRVEPMDPDTYFKLSAPWKDVERTLPRSQVRDADKKRAQLRKLGDLRFEVLTGGEDLAASLYACFGLEASGWKGQRGSPVLGSADTQRFYTNLAVRASAAGHFVLYLLRLDGRIIAFGYGLRGESRVDLLKIGYDQSLSEASPGRLLQLSAMEHECDGAITTTFHLGRVSAWKQRWSPRLMPLCRVWVLSAGLRSRALLGTTPLLRSTVRSNRALLEAVQWARTVRRGESTGRVIRDDQCARGIAQYR